MWNVDCLNKYVFSTLLEQPTLLVFFLVRQRYHIIGHVSNMVPIFLQ